MTELLRTETAGFSIADTVSLDDLNEENIKNFIKPADKALPSMNSAFVTEKQAIRFSNGGELDLIRLKGEFSDDEIVKVKFGNIFLGLGRVMKEKGFLKVECVINDAKGSDTNA